MSALAAFLVALALFFGGGGATALAAQDALPNDLLYPVKLATEDLQLGLSSEPVQQMEMLENWIDRRFQEMHELTQAGEAVPLQATYRLERQLGLALQTASRLGDPELQEALLQLQIRLETHRQTMEQLRTADPNGAALQAAEQALSQTQAHIQGALQDPAAFRTRTGAGRPEDAPQQPDVLPGDPDNAPGAGGEETGQGSNTEAGQGPNAEAGQNGGGQAAGQQDGSGAGDGTCGCTQQADGSWLCSAACQQYAQGTGDQAGYGPGTSNCQCTPQADGSLVCPSTCVPYFFNYSTPGPNGHGQGGSSN